MFMELQGFHRRQAISVTLLMLMAVLIYSLEAFFNFRESGVLSFSFLYFAGGAVLSLTNLFIIKFLKNVSLAVLIALLTVFSDMAFLLKTDVLGEHGIFWGVTIPLIFFLLLGKKRGLILSIFLLLMVLSALILDYFMILDTTFSLLQAREPGLIYLTVTACAYVMEHFREMDERMSSKTSKETAGTNKQLENEIQNRKKVEAQLKKHGEETEKLNKLMIGRELKMVELKKELDRLKGKSTKE